MTEEAEKSEKNQSVIRNALSMSMGTMMSRLLGLARDTVLAAMFTVTQRDVYVVAFTLPNLFRRLLGEGALAVSFIPIYLDTKQNKGENAAMNLSSAVLVILLSVTAALSALGIAFMPQIIDVLASGDGFTKVEGKIDLTIAMSRVMFGYLFLVTCYGYMMSICQASRRFFLPALAPALFNLTLIVFMFLPMGLLGFEASNLAAGVIVGGVIQVGVVIYQLISLNVLPTLRWKGFAPEVKKVFKNMAPGILGLGVLQIMTLVNMNLATRIQEGAPGYFYFANRILELPQSLIAISMGSALLPALSTLWSQNQQQKATSELFRHIRFMLFLAIPSGVGMYCLGKDIIGILFQRYEFTVKDALLTSYIVQIYSLLLFFASFVKVIVTGFYAKKNTWYPATTSAITLCFHVVIAYVLTNEYGIKGLASATVISTSINMFLLLTGYYFLVDKFSWLKVIAMPAQFLPAAFVMGVFITYANQFFLSVFGLNSVSKIVSLFATILFGVMVYFMMSKVFRVKEVALLSKFKK